MQTAKYLGQAGDRHSYQIYTIVFVCIKWTIVSLTVFLPSYLLATPTFTCDQELRVSQTDACWRLDKCHMDFPETITAHMGLYCDKKYLRDSVISSEFVGSVVGLVVLSMLADRLGRKAIIVSTLFFTALGSMLLTLGAYYRALPLLYFGLILMGFGGFALSMVSYSYLTEVNNDIWRQKSLILTYSFWAIGQTLLYPIITWVEHWLTICFYIFIVPLLCLILMSYFIVQTPQFLFVQGRYTQCLDSLNYIAKFNKREPILSIEQPLPENKREPEKLTDAFTKIQFLVPLVVLSFAQICNNALYYTTQYSINQLGESFQFNMLIIGVLELISCIITNFYCQRMYRKRWIMIFMVLSGTIGLVIQLTPQSSGVELVFIGFSRLFNTFGFALFSLITTQSFPTSIRSTGTGVSEAMSNLGNMLAPFLVTISDEIGVKGVFFGGIICIAGGLSMTFVKQTKKKKQAKNPLIEQDSDEIEEHQNSLPGSQSSSSASSSSQKLRRQS